MRANFCQKQQEDVGQVPAHTDAAPNPRAALRWTSGEGDRRIHCYFAIMGEAFSDRALKGALDPAIEHGTTPDQVPEDVWPLCRRAIHGEAIERIWGMT